eukprot:2431896-Pyramimonas_sp.AAC.1
MQHAMLPLIMRELLVNMLGDTGHAHVDVSTLNRNDGGDHMAGSNVFERGSNMGSADLPGVSIAEWGVHSGRALHTKNLKRVELSWIKKRCY